MKYFKITLLSLTIASFAFTSCDDTVDELNSDAIENTTLHPDDNAGEDEDDPVNSGGG